MKNLESSILKLLKLSLLIIAIIICICILIVSYCSYKSHAREIYSNHDDAPPNGFFIKAHDIDIFYQREGQKNKPTVLLIHGTGAWSEIWRDTITHLVNNNFDVIAVDVPPFGYSDKPEGSFSYSRTVQAKRIIDLINKLNLDKVNVIAHSVGSRPAIEAVYQIQNKINSLVLVDAALGFNTDKNISQFEQNSPSIIEEIIFNIHPIRNSLMASYATNPYFSKNIFKSFVHKKDSVTDKMVITLQKPLTLENMNRAQADWLEFLMIDEDNSYTSDFQSLSNITTPTLLIWGKEDNITPLWQGKKLQKLVPNSQLQIIDNSGHIPYIEDMDTFNKKVLKFLKENN